MRCAILSDSASGRVCWAAAVRPAIHSTRPRTAPFHPPPCASSTYGVKRRPTSPQVCRAEVCPLQLLVPDEHLTWLSGDLADEARLKPAGRSKRNQAPRRHLACPVEARCRPGGAQPWWPADRRRRGGWGAGRLSRAPGGRQRASLPSSRCCARRCGAPCGRRCTRTRGHGHPSGPSIGRSRGRRSPPRPWGIGGAA